ncbi:MAG TPA: hypothetical protein VFW17_04735 [Ktedonobacterales bacterium]|nr:hypothetical protein [Ktedonobacterales bacterium]
MSRFLHFVWLRWLWVLEPPWQHSGPDDERLKHRVVWYAGWAWTLAGLAGGAVHAPALLEFAGMLAPYQPWQGVGVAVVMSLLGLLLGWAVVTVTNLLWAVSEMAEELRQLWEAWEYIGVSSITMLFLLPLCAVGLEVYRYWTWVGPGQWDIAITFVSGLLIISLLKGIVSGAVFRWVMKWLRGGKNTKNA